MRDRKRTLSGQIRNIRQNIGKDNDIYIRFGFNPSLAEFLNENAPLFAFKILFAYALSVIKREDEEQYGILQKHFESYKFDALRINSQCEDNLMEFQSDMILYSEQILEALSFFGWKVTQFENYAVRTEDMDLSQFKAKDVKDFIRPYIETVYYDSLENDGEMDLFVLENERIGKYYSFVKSYPERAMPLLHKAIEDAEVFLYVPMYYWESEFHGEYVSQEGVFYTTFATGYCGGMCRHSGAYLISPGCLPMACYMNRLLQMAEDEIPGFREFANS